MKAPYTCYRCGYTTRRKDHMHRHLYLLSKQCPGVFSIEDLSEHIKSSILSNRTYSPPKSCENVLYQTINNYNQINNFISRMDPMEKLTKYVEYNNIDLIGFEDLVENKYAKQIEKLEAKSYKDFYLDHHTILDVVNSITLNKDIDTMNVVHDSIGDKLNIYNHGSWQSFLFDQGIEDILNTLKSTYLDIYEDYLVERYKEESRYKKQCIKERLQDYYRFLVCFGLKPSKNDDDNDFFMNIYKGIEDEIKLRDVNQVRRKVHDIIKKNSKCNILELNNKMMDIMQMDEIFKQRVLNKLRVCIESEKNDQHTTNI